jgi:hypothetical protein
MPSVKEEMGLCQGPEACNRLEPLEACGRWLRSRKKLYERNNSESVSINENFYSLRTI